MGRQSRRAQRVLERELFGPLPRSGRARPRRAPPGCEPPPGEPGNCWACGDCCEPDGGPWTCFACNVTYLGWQEGQLISAADELVLDLGEVRAVGGRLLDAVTADECRMVVEAGR